MKNAKNRLKNICKKGSKSSRKNYIYLLNRKSPEISAVWRHFCDGKSDKESSHTVLKRLILRRSG